MASDIEIAQAAIPQPIGEIADKLSIPDEALEPYGRIKGKVSLDWLLEQPVRDKARMILVTAISPTPSGRVRLRRRWAWVMHSVTSVKTLLSAYVSPLWVLCLV